MVNISINQLVTTSDVAVVGTVKSVSPTRWNSPDGEPWERDPNNPDYEAADPFHYRVATLTISSVLFAAPTTKLSVGQDLAISLYGSGENTGATLNGDAADRWNQIAGPFLAGTEELVLLRSVAFPMSDGPHPDTYVLNQDRDGHWVLEGGQAHSSVPGRSAPFSALRDRILAEHGRGPVQETPAEVGATSIDPLGPMSAGTAPANTTG